MGELLGFNVGNFMWIAPVGLLMGITYLAAIKWTREGWAFGELTWGFVLWGSCAWLIN